MSGTKIAIVADWLPTFGGAEHVIAEFCRLWPHAPLFTTIANPKRLGPIAQADLRVSRLQCLYRLLGTHEWLLPLMPKAMERVDLSDYDVILSSSHAIAKGIVPPSTARHVCYCHTPMRYAWSMESDYLARSRIPKILHKHIRSMLTRLRRWDLTTAKRVDQFIANSTEVAGRIREIYNRDSIVIPPPVDSRFFNEPIVDNPGTRNQYLLAIGRLIPYKRFDLLIELANKRGLPLKIAGTGSQEAHLKRMAGPTVEFLGFVPDNSLPTLYSHAKALFFPQHEDAGIVALEAQACGTPVIALKKGGALDAIQENTTGVFFEEQILRSLEEAIDRFETINFDPKKIREHARQFSAERFQEAIQNVIEQEKDI